MSWRLGLTRLAAVVGGDLQAAARRAGGGRRLWEAGSRDLERWMRLDAEGLRRVIECRGAMHPRRELAAMSERSIGWIPGDDARMPAAIGALVDAPFGLFTLGRPLDAVMPPDRPVVAIVGSRRATAFGARFTERIAGALAARGAVVVSGLALGIDAAAHQGALDAGRATVAVLGGGVDVVYPRRHRALRERIVAEGVLLSEYWPGTSPAPWRFPARNRIVAGLADAVVVVEAGERSGALITADFALELGRPVLAVPGAPGSAASAGCHTLLRAGAALCETEEDVIVEVPAAMWDAPATPGAPVELDGVEASIYRLLQTEPLRSDELVERLGVGAAGVAAALARLEIGGLVLRGQAQRFWAAPLRGAA